MKMQIQKKVNTVGWAAFVDRRIPLGFLRDVDEKGLEKTVASTSAQDSSRSSMRCYCHNCQLIQGHHLRAQTKSQRWGVVDYSGDLVASCSGT